MTPPSTTARALIIAACLAGSALASSAAAAPALRLRKAEFRDIHMGNVVAYTMLVPDGWKAQGHIEWSQAQTPYPQTKIDVVAPDKSKISFYPALTFSYAESPQMNMRQGIPPPTDFGAWFVSFVAQNNPNISKVELVKITRDTAAEKALAEQSRQLGQPVQGQWQINLVRFRFVMDGVPFTQETHVSFATNPPAHTSNMTMVDWMLFFNSDVRAPSAVFEALRPVLYASAHSLRSVPQWWAQQQRLIMDITRRNHEIGMAEIKRRAQAYDQLSDASLAEWKKQQAASDRQQGQRINAIYEVDDFRDTDGLTVKLPSHYAHHYADGRGGYLLTDAAEKPGGAWTPLAPAK